MVISICLPVVEQNLMRFGFSNPYDVLSDSTKIFYATFYLKEYATVWQLNVVSSGAVQESWTDVYNATPDHVTLFPDLLRTLRKISIVSN